MYKDSIQMDQQGAESTENTDYLGQTIDIQISFTCLWEKM